MKIMLAAIAAMAVSVGALWADVTTDVTVVDGDTLDLGGTRYRINGIDAPEMAQRCLDGSGRIWACGAAARVMLNALTDGKRVRCHTLTRDRYGRDIARCTANGRDLGAEMVLAGLAWAYRRFSEAYVVEEFKAKSARRGIWQGEATPAWEERRKSWNVAETRAPEGCPIKGNISKGGKIYHMPWSSFYRATRINTAKGERWFCNEAEAIAAGWRAAKTQ